jgi:glycosyltransferase involved in cell wall biosynthesis
VRILVATDVTVRGGVDRYVTDLAAALTRSGHEVVVALERTTASALPEMISDLGVPVHLVAQYHRRHSAQLIKSASTQLLAELAPDGLHAACGSPFSCIGLREAAAQRGVSCIVTEQFVDDALALTASQRERIKLSYLRARHVVFVSEGNRATMQRLVGLQDVAHSVVPNGVDVDAIRRRLDQIPGRASRPGSGAARLMTASRLAPAKGLDVLVRAVAELPSSTVARLDLYGEGPERDPLEHLINDLGLADRAFLHPWLTDVIEQMAVHDLFVLPSRAEGMPYVVLEAMAAGIPVVATAVAGTAEALAHGLVGALIAEPTVAALAAVIRRSLAQPEDTAQRALAAAGRAAASYDVGLQMRRTVALWTQHH